jgi:hypothetical protein
MWLFINVIDSSGIKARRSAFNPMHFIAFGKEKLG